MEARLKTQGITIRLKEEIDPSSYIAIDTENKYLTYLSTLTNQLNTYEIAQLQSIALLKDGETIYQKSTGSAMGRAAVGSILFGGIGAALGVASAESKAKEKKMSIYIW